jgi:hypothetical protein
MKPSLFHRIVVTLLSLSGMALLGWLAWTAYRIATGMALYHFWLLATVGSFLWLALVHGSATEYAHRPRHPRVDLVISVSGDPLVRRPFLVSFPGGLRGSRTVTAGRSAECRIRLGNPSISSAHCAITLTRRGDILVEDLGSTNGTSVNEARLAPHRPLALRPPAQVRLPGPVTLNLLMEESDAR